MSVVDGSVWLSSAQRLWDQGLKQQAVQQVLDVINSAGSQRPRKPCIQLAFYMYLNGDYQPAIAVLSELNSVYPGDPEIVEHLAVNYSRAGMPREALAWLRQAQALVPASWNILDGIAANAALLELWDEARSAGEQSLDLKDASVVAPSNWTPPSLSAEAWFSDRPTGSDVISFSLWGPNPRYLRGALRNLLLIPELLPGWKPRIYLDSSVPRLFVERVQELGAEIVVQPTTNSILQRLSWRFLVASDPGVSRFLVRDCDSVISLREVLAVRDWIASDCCFHVMRDWWSHTDLVLAGLWGGVAGWLPDMRSLIDNYQCSALTTPNIDQWFLRDRIWPLIRASVLVHDRCFRSRYSRLWPEPDTSKDLHVGANEASLRHEHQCAWLKPWLDSMRCLRDPFTPGPTSQDLEAAIPELRARMPQQLSQHPRQSCTLDHVKGFYINLATQVDRDQAMRIQLDRLGLTDVYHRFDAVGASLAEAQSVGLKSAGELGLWRSTLFLLQSLEDQSFPPRSLIHILEDDAVLGDQWPFHLARTLPALVAEPSVDFDLLFTDAFLTPSLARRLCEIDQFRSPYELLFLDGGLYLACASSYLVPVSSLERLRRLLLRAFECRPLQPLDMVIRDLMLTSQLRLLIAYPFLTTIASGAGSAIQTTRASSVSLRMELDILLRRQSFVDKPPLATDLQLWFKDFLSSIPDAHQVLMTADLIDHWESSGLLPSY
jgi:GR25 family glycosyltransferase involved in LPS biosynthesis